MCNIPTCKAHSYTLPNLLLNNLTTTKSVACHKWGCMGPANPLWTCNTYIYYCTLLYDYRILTYYIPLYIILIICSPAPEGPPTNFHAIVLNRTAIEAQWDQPLLSLRNGNIRGYKLFVQPRGGSEREIDIPVNTTLGVSYIIRDLRPRTVYIISVLAYTTGEMRGPRSIHLTAQTLSLGKKKEFYFSRS